MVRKLLGPAVIAFIVFMIAYEPTTAANTARSVGGFLGQLATGGADMLGQLFG